ncbi:MAG: A/G-specific adenine glycosylase [Polyangiaceae bacterium]
MARTGKPTSIPSADARARHLARLLLRWYDASARDLPWRSGNPYAVWVSEIMLQQTQVSTVLPYFRAWMKRFPSVHALARASEADVLHAWQGLGYYSRARNLQRGAVWLLRENHGRLPESAEQLRRLPGVGPYTAGAIASIAFGERTPVVDGNVSRVLARIFAIPGHVDQPAHVKQIWRLAESLVPARRPGDFNQALMELGALRCRPERPLCDGCPMAQLCEARRSDSVDRYGRKRPRPAPTAVRMVAAIVERADRVALVRLGAGAPRWAGMWQFPCVELQARESALRGAERASASLIGLRAHAREELDAIAHAVTRYAVRLTPVLCRTRGQRLTAKGVERAEWVPRAELFTFAMPAAHAKIRKQLT